MTNDTPEIAALRMRFEEWWKPRYGYLDFHVCEGLNMAYEEKRIAWQAFIAGAKTEPVPVPSDDKSYLLDNSATVPKPRPVVDNFHGERDAY